MHLRPALLVGIPDETVEFGMTVNETIDEAGVPDEKYDKEGINRCTYVYHDRECFGESATITYVFNGHETNKDAYVFRAYLDIDVRSQSECERIMEEQRKYFESLLNDDGDPDIKILEVSSRAWESEDLEQECLITSAQRCVAIQRFSNRILTYIYLAQ